jgi:hypothetical protein
MNRGMSREATGVSCEKPWSCSEKSRGRGLRKDKGEGIKCGLFLYEKADFPFLGLRRGHQLADRIEYGLDLLVMGADSTF